MIGFQLYTFFICLLVFIVLTCFFAFMIIYIGKQTICLIENGIVDENVIKSINREKDRNSKKSKRVFGMLSRITSAVFLCILSILFVFVGISSCIGNDYVKSIPAIKVVSSTSMSEKYENNTYLFNNNLDDQIQLFDLVILHKLPKEDEIKIYDIVVYEHISGALLLHRIVGIEEPNETHPNERYFLLQGDAVHYPDTFPVRYEQMKSIYKGTRIPNLGSFVFFMQSPSGIICMILIVCCMILMPISDAIVMKKAKERYQVLQEIALARKLEEAKKQQTERNRLEELRQKSKNITLKEKLQKNDVARLRYYMLKPYFENIEGSRLIEGKNTYTYKKENKYIAKITVVGKTLNIYFALSPEEFVDTKYKFIDVSNKKKFKNCPMRVRITSDRQAKWAMELTKILENKLMDKNGG